MLVYKFSRVVLCSLLLSIAITTVGASGSSSSPTPSEGSDLPSADRAQSPTPTRRRREAIDYGCDYKLLSATSVVPNQLSPDTTDRPTIEDALHRHKMKQRPLPETPPVKREREVRAKEAKQKKLYHEAIAGLRKSRLAAKEESGYIQHWRNSGRYSEWDPVLSFMTTDYVSVFKSMERSMAVEDNLLGAKRGIFHGIITFNTGGEKFINLVSRPGMDDANLDGGYVYFFSDIEQLPQ